jgi:hypothetical protein
MKLKVNKEANKAVNEDEKNKEVNKGEVKDEENKAIENGYRCDDS